MLKHKNSVLYIHGKGGSASESEHYIPLFPDHDVVGFDYKAQTPWQAKEEFAAEFSELCKKYESIIVVANSIGAFFAMCSLPREKIERAFFISPIVDMEKLICDMMYMANVSENELKEKETIETSFGETLSWEYLCYVRAHPIDWCVRTDILYGEKDNLTNLDTITSFSSQVHASLTVMPNGEHWFHTLEQMAFLDDWIISQMQ